MKQQALPNPAPHVLWVYTESPTEALDAATWTETTRELRALGWRVTLVAVGAAGLQQARGVEIFGIPKPNIYLLRQVIFHMRLLRLISLLWGDVDVVLFHQMSAPWLFPLRIVRRVIHQRRPILVMDTRTVPMTVRTRKDQLRAIFDRLMNRLAHRWADGQTAITLRMAENVRIPSAKLLGVWSSGVTLEQFAPARVARHWPQAGEPIELIYIGVLHRERCIKALCEAVERAHAIGLAFGLTIVGSGPERAELEAFAQHTNGRVRVLESVPHAHIPSLLAAAQVGVLPFPDTLMFRVSSPVKLFEYLAAGMPILATRIACHTDVVGDRDCAFWAADASVEQLLGTLRLIWRRAGDLEMMGREAATTAPAWTWAAAAHKLSTALASGLQQTNGQVQ
jgi:glycosyltransferase involved in cell wall biosynthesis